MYFQNYRNNLVFATNERAKYIVINLWTVNRGKGEPLRLMYYGIGLTPNPSAILFQPRIGR